MDVCNLTRVSHLILCGCASECKCVGHFVCVRENVPRYVRVFSLCMTKSVCVSVSVCWAIILGFYHYSSRVCTIFLIFTGLEDTPDCIVCNDISFTLTLTQTTRGLSCLKHSRSLPPVFALLLKFTVSVLPFIKSCLRITSMTGQKNMNHIWMQINTWKRKGAFVCITFCS